MIFIASVAIGFGILPSYVKAFEQIKFMDDELILVCSTEHPFSCYDEIDLDMLDGQDFILRERGSDDREFFESFLAANELEINIRWESISIIIIFEAVKAGLGLTILPDVIVKAGASLGNVHMIKIKKLSLKRQFSIIYQKK